MTTIPDKITTWQIVEPPVLNKETGRIDPGKFDLVEIPVPELKAGQVLVEVAGCAICRSGAESDGAQTGISLVYEISGTVVAGDDTWMGKEVLIPAVLPCGQCDFCVKGYGPCCDNPRTALNHRQIPSCFSSHIPVSGSSLFEIRHRKRSLPLEHLAGVVGALMTPFQTLRRVSLNSSDPVIVMGVCGCLPGNYPQILEMVTSGKIPVSPFVLTRPMSWIHETFQEINSLTQDKRIILTTDDFGLNFSMEPKSCR